MIDVFNQSVPDNIFSQHNQINIIGMNRVGLVIPLQNFTNHHSD